MTEKLKILVGDDNQKFCESFKEKLAAKGVCLICQSQNGFEFLKAIEDNRPQFIILNVFMTSIDGLGIIRKVKESFVSYRPVFIMLSDFDFPSLTDAIKKETDFYFIKPVDTGILEKIIFSVSKSPDIMLTAKSELMAPISIIERDEEQLQNLEVKVTENLHRIGIPAHIKGYRYLREAIIMTMENPNIINYVTKELYPAVAEKFDTTPSRVERAMRHAIELAWDRCDMDVLNEIFGCTVHAAKGKPTNSEFIAMLADRLLLIIKKNGLKLK